MDKRLGSSAGILALLAVLLHTLSNSAGERANSAAKDETSIAASKVAAEATELSPEQQGPWRATQQYFHSSPSGLDDKLKGCLARPTDECLRNSLLLVYGFPANYPASAIHSILTMVPDPLHTRMATETDRSLDAIQQAAFRSDWELATQWLPWSLKGAGQLMLTKDPKVKSYDLEKLPGLLVFRHHFTPNVDTGEVLLIFVAGETPTSGVNGFQFDLARQTISRLGSARPDTLLIAGPNFSGSFLPLARLLEQKPESTHFVLRSASVSNSDYAQSMLLELQSRGFSIDRNSPGKPSIDFASFGLPSTAFRRHFAHLVSAFGLQPRQAAELVEDETGFGYSNTQDKSGTDENAIATFRYPRDIAQLRNSYNDAAFNGPSAESKPAQAIEFSLRDTQSGEDIFPIFSKNHTPVSQYAQLEQITRFLNRQNIRLVSLSATNVFDTLFLANVLAQDCPDTRIVLRGPDLLFAENAPQASLAGVMAISAFPLFPEGERWSSHINNPGRAFDQVTFATADQIGEFNALLSLLSPAGKPAPQERMFEAPIKSDAMFSAWVLVLGSSGWLPVDLYAQPNPAMQLKGQSADWFDKLSAVPGRTDIGSPMLSAGRGWTALSLCVAVFTFAFCGWLFYLKLQPKRLVWSVLCLSDLGTPGRRHAINDIVHSRYLCMISCFASLALINGLLLGPMWAASVRYSGPVGLILQTVLTITYCFSIGTAIYLSVFVPLRVCQEGPLQICPVDTPISFWSIGLRVSILGLSICGVWAWWTCLTNGVSGYFLCFRTLALAAPVCPIWPLLLATAGLFALAFFHLRRFTWGDRRQPNLETSLFDEALCDEFQHLKERLDRDLLRPFSVSALPGVPLLALTACLIVLFLAILFPSESLRSFEAAQFSWLLGFLLLPLGVFTLLSFVRFIRCWNITRAFLVSLNSVVLGRFFSRIPEFGGSGPVWVREVKLMSLATAVNSAIALHNLEASCDGMAFASDYAAKLRNLLAPKNGQGTRLDFMYAYAEFRQCAATISQKLGASVLRPFWKANKLPFVGVTVAEPIDEPTPAAPPALAGSAMGIAKPAEVRSFGAAAGQLQSLFLSTTTSILDAPNHVQQAEEAPEITEEAYEFASRYVAFQYATYIGYVLHHLRNLLLCCITCFVLLVTALNSFSFQAPQSMFRFLTVTLIVSAAAVLVVLAQMERDPILSRLSGTAEGELGKDFYWRALSYGALPVLTILSTHFPSIAHFVSNWIQPASSVLR